MIGWMDRTLQLFMLVMLIVLGVQSARLIERQARIEVKLIDRQDEQTRLLRLVCLNTLKDGKAGSLCLSPPKTGS